MLSKEEIFVFVVFLKYKSFSLYTMYVLKLSFNRKTLLLIYKNVIVCINIVRNAQKKRNKKNYWNLDLTF